MDVTDLSVITASAVVVLSVLVGLYALLLACRNPGWPRRLRWSPGQERRFMPVFILYWLALWILAIPRIVWIVDMLVD